MSSLIFITSHVLLSIQNIPCCMVRAFVDLSGGHCEQQYCGKLGCLAQRQASQGVTIAGILFMSLNAARVPPRDYPRNSPRYAGTRPSSGVALRCATPHAQCVFVRGLQQMKQKSFIAGNNKVDIHNSFILYNNINISCLITNLLLLMIVIKL